jgi:hypothetical protein
VPVVSDGAEQKIEYDNEHEHEPEKDGERRCDFSLTAEL